MIRLDRDGAIAVLTIDNPPVNATSQAVRRGLLDALGSAAADAQTAAIVIIGAGGRYSAGGDVRELGNTALNLPSLLDTIALIEASNKPVIAAMQGVALGGGLELALACHYRIGTAPLKVGLPEVTLGVIPGAGGTQRLPRLIGPHAALEIISSGRHVEAAEALRLGLLDLLVEGPLLAAAVAFARSAVQRQLPLPVSRRSERIAAIDPDLFEDFRRAHAVAWRGQLAPWRIVDAIEQACTRPPEAGAGFERAAYVECQSSPQRAALAYLFTARRAAKKSDLAARTPLIAARLRAVPETAEGDSMQWSGAAAWPQDFADAVADEGRRLLADGIAMSAAEIDVVAVDTLGFPAHCGGPMYAAATSA